jgi:hypothetical protein
MWRHVTHVRHYKRGFAELKQKMNVFEIFYAAIKTAERSEARASGRRFSIQ